MAPEFIETPGSGTATQKRTRVQKPKRYKVLLLNDNYTTMDFVVEVLMQIFRKPEEEAMRIMMNVHKNGLGIAGVYVKQVAEAKVELVHAEAQAHGHPLRCTIEPE